MDPKEELDWRRRFESKVDKLFEIVTDIRITCAGRNACGSEEAAEPQVLGVQGDGLTGREKFLLALVGFALTIIGILAGIAFG